MKIHGVTGSRNDGVLSEIQQKALDRRQSQCAKRVEDCWAESNGHDLYPEIAMPTGFGKGRVVHRLLKSSKHNQILTIVGSKNILLDQSRDVLEGLAKEDTGEADFSILPDLSGRVVLSTWQGLHSFSRKHTKRPDFGLAVIDEVHNIGTASRIELLKWLKPEHAVGLTATAVRASGKFRVPEQYGFTVVDSMPLPECIDKRWLSPLMGISIDTQVMLPASVRKGIGEINQRKMAQALRKYPHLFDDIAVDIANRFLPSGMKTVIVVNRVNEEACVIAKELVKRGFKVGLAVNQNAARKLSGQFITLDAISRFKLPHGHPESIQVLISPQVIGEGFDAPATECVIWACPTMSHVRYTQVIGRGSRRCWMKKYCLIVDYVYMIENYGYSLNFAQFFKKDEMQELDGGFMYVGPEDVGRTIELPHRFCHGGKIVSVIDLRKPVYPSAGDWLTCAQLSLQLRRSESWVAEKLKELFSQFGQIRLDQTGHSYLHYPPSVKDEMSELATEHKNANGWFTVLEIASEIGRSRKWVKEHIGSFRGEIRLNNNNAPHTHYPPRVLGRLRQLCGSQPADGWLTLNQISLKLGRDKGWVVSRLDEKPAGFGEMRSSEDGQECLHYPQSALRFLRSASKKEKPAGGWLACPQICKKLKKSENWVRLRLGRYFSDKCEMRKGANRKLSPHYPPSIIQKLKEMEEKE